MAMIENFPSMPEAEPKAEKAQPLNGESNEGKPNENQMMKKTLERLEKSDQSAFIKELMITYLAERQMTDPTQQSAFLDKVKTGNVTIGQIVECMAEVALQNDPTLQKRLEMKEVSISQVAEGAIDQMFAVALQHANSSAFPENMREDRILQIQTALKELQNTTAQD